MRRALSLVPELVTPRNKVGHWYGVARDRPAALARTPVPRSPRALAYVRLWAVISAADPEATSGLKATPMATQADVRRIALSLPQTEEAVDRFAFSVRNKGKLKGFVWVWMERIEPKKPRVPQPDVIAVRVASLAEKDRLLACPDKVLHGTALQWVSRNSCEPARDHRPRARATHQGGLAVPGPEGSQGMTVPDRSASPERDATSTAFMAYVLQAELEICASRQADVSNSAIDRNLKPFLYKWATDSCLIRPPGNGRRCDECLC